MSTDAFDEPALVMHAPAESAVEVVDLRVVLGQRTILDAVSPELSAGEVVALVGSNGSGKTTLLRALVGLVPIAEGAVHRHGSASPCNAIGATTGDPAFVGWMTPVSFGKMLLESAGEGDLGRVRRSLDEVGLDRAEQGRRLGKLSQGQRGLAAVVLGAEAEQGVAAGREQLLLGRSALVVRMLGLLVMWAAATLVVFLLALLASRLAAIDVRWPFGTGVQSTARFVALRAAGALIAVSTFSLLLVSLRRRLTSRARWLAAGALLVALMLAAASNGSSVLPPTSLGWDFMQFQDALLTFMDRLPLTLVVRKPALDPSLVLAAWLVAIGLVLATVSRTRRGGEQPTARRPIDVEIAGGSG